MSIKAAEIYTECLLPLKEGYPMYRPELHHRNDDAYTNYRRKGVSIGDVGILRPGGDFDFLFNICKPPDSNSGSALNTPDVTGRYEAQVSETAGSSREPGHGPLNAVDVDEELILTSLAGVPESSGRLGSIGGVEAPEHAQRRTEVDSPASVGGFGQIDAGVISTTPGYISTDHPYMAHGTEEQRSINVEASVNPISVVSLDAGWKFECTWKRGAVVVAPEGATLTEVLEETRFLRSIERVKGWFKYVDERNRQFTSLVLVTGVTSVSFSLMPAASGNVSASHSWREYLPTMCHSGPKPPSQVENQCLFIRGYRIMKQNPVSRLAGMVQAADLREGSTKYYKLKKPTSTGRPAASDSVQQTHTGGSSVIGGGVGDLQDVDNASTEENYVVENISDPGEPYYPSDVINRYLLQRFPEAEFAITHDKHWWALFEDQEIASLDEHELLSRVCGAYKAVLRQGVVFLQENANCIEDDLNESTEAVLPQKTTPDSSREATVTNLGQNKLSDVTRGDVVSGLPIAPPFPTLHESHGYDFKVFLISQALSKFDPGFSPSQNPQGWLRANTQDLFGTLQAFSDSDLFHWKQTGCWQYMVDKCSIYHRALIYTFARIVAFAQESRQSLLDDLMEAVKLWRTWDYVTTVINHRHIGKYLWKCIQTCDHMSAHNRGKDNWLTNLLVLDTVGIYVQVVVILQDPGICDSFFSRRGDEAQILLDLLLEFLDTSKLDNHIKKTLLRALSRLSEMTNLLPGPFVLDGVEGLSREPATSGAFSDIFTAKLQGQAIAIKRMRYRMTNVSEAMKAISREAILWSLLSHPNILPFYGIYYFNNNLSLVSPWMANGTVVDFLQCNPVADRRSLYLDVILGLEYLHTESIIHGDLKGLNILITPTGRACLADFALADVVLELADFEETEDAYVTTLRWQAPELLSPYNIDENWRKTFASDIYSFACVGYEMFSNNIPFHGLHDNLVILRVLAGQRPARPSAEIGGANGLDDAIWNIIEACWAMLPKDRPKAWSVVNQLRACVVPTAKDDLAPNSDWDPSLLRKSQSSLDIRTF